MPILSRLAHSFRRAFQHKHEIPGIFRRDLSTQPLTGPSSRKTRIRWILIGGVVFVSTYYVLKKPFLHEAGPKGLKKQKLVVLGSGWGAVSVLKQIDTDRYDVVCVSPRNFFLMTPLIPSVAVGTIEGRTVCEAIRMLFGDRISFVEAECTDVDPVNKVVHCRRTGPAQLNSPDTEDNIVSQVEDRQKSLLNSSSRRVKDSARSRPPFELAYDKLVVCVGAESNTFGIPGVEKHAHFLKELVDAQRVRTALSDCFESAATPGQSPKEKRRLLHFVVVGGGPTGVEFAAELADMVHEDCSRYYPDLTNDVKITLVEALDHILSAYDKKISEYTTEHFKRASINVVPNTFVKKVSQSSVTVQRKGEAATEEWPCAVVVWATGIKSRPLTGRLREVIGDKTQTNRNALLTNPYLKVEGAEDIFAIGDCASINQPRLLSRLEELFHEADKSGKGELDLPAFKAFVKAHKDQFPQLELYAKDIKEVFATANKDGNETLSLEEFSSLLHDADSKLRALPATAQVAVQEGKYLGTLLNHLDRMERGETRVEFEPFRYKHFGSLAYIGGDYAVADFTNTSGPILDFFGLSPMKGRGTFWLWRSFYLSEMFSTRLKLLLAFDWTRTKLFGRDISRV